MLMIFQIYEILMELKQGSQENYTQNFWFQNLICTLMFNNQFLLAMSKIPIIIDFIEIDSKEID